MAGDTEGGCWVIHTPSHSDSTLTAVIDLLLAFRFEKHLLS